LGFFIPKNMSLTLDFTIEDSDCSCNLLTFTDTTNLGAGIGWGDGVTDSRTDMTECLLLIDFPNGTESSIDITSELNILADSTAYTKSISITDFDTFTSESLFPAGVYTFVFKCTASDATVYTVTKTYFFWCSYKSCLNTMLQGYTESTCCGGCEEKTKNKIIRTSTLLSALQKAAECKDLTRFNTIKATLDSLCGTTTSNCGCG
jgi:hypothetical protein